MGHDWHDDWKSYDEWKGWHGDTFGQPGKKESRFFQAEIAPLLAKVQGPAHVLEIGFGNGSLLGWCRDQGHKVIGMEIQPKLVERAVSAGFPVAQDLSEIEAGSIDLVVAMDVFEHVEFAQLVSLCEAAKAALKPGGHLVARFPNGDSPFGMVLQNADPTHILALGRGKVEALMQQAGLELLQLRAPHEVALSPKAKMATPLKKILRAAWRQYARLAFLGGSTPSTFGINYWLVARKID